MKRWSEDTQVIDSRMKHLKVVANTTPSPTYCTTELFLAPRSHDDAWLPDRTHVSSFEQVSHYQLGKPGYSLAVRSSLPFPTYLQLDMYPGRKA